jgi:hypothetical protein
LQNLCGVNLSRKTTLRQPLKHKAPEEEELRWDPAHAKQGECSETLATSLHEDEGSTTPWQQEEAEE